MFWRLLLILLPLSGFGQVMVLKGNIKEFGKDSVEIRIDIP
jgi:hypothetical protein